jgi:hypothetical protein
MFAMSAWPGTLAHSRFVRSRDPSPISPSSFRAPSSDLGVSWSAPLQLIAGVRGALNGLLAELLDDYIRTHAVDPSNTEQAFAAAQLLDVIRSYWQ